VGCLIGLLDDIDDATTLQRHGSLLRAHQNPGFADGSLSENGTSYAASCTVALV
jgi:hypothetical protein